MKLGSLIIETNLELAISLIVSGLLFLGMLGAIAAKSSNRRRVIPRLLAHSFAILALILILIQPQWQTGLKKSPVLLITPGATKADLAALTDSIHFNPVLVLDNTGVESDISSAKSVPDIDFLNRKFPEISKLFIAGHGLKKYDLDQIENASVTLLPSVVKPWITTISWQRELIIGQELQVRGSMAGFAENEGWVYFSDMAEKVDSLRIEKGKTDVFRLSATPRAIGNWQYKISLVTDDSDTLFEEKVSVSVQEAKPVKILLVESAPSFETRFLKEMIAHSGHALAIKTTISLDRFRSEFINSPKRNLANLDQSALKHFDLLIVDSKSLAGFNKQDLLNIHKAVSEIGLGVLLIPDESLTKALGKGEKLAFLADFGLKGIEDLDSRTIKLRLINESGDFLAGAFTEAMEIENTKFIQPLIKDSQNRVVAAAKIMNQGKIGLSLIKDTYRWVLEGQTHSHAAYWSFLISELARKTDNQDKLLLPNPPIYFVDEPLEIRLFSQSVQLGGVISTKMEKPDSLRFQQDISEHHLWRTTFWPLNSGWHSIKTTSGVTTSFYVYERDEWQTWQQADKISATQRYALRDAPRFQAGTDEGMQTGYKPIPLTWIFLVFLACCTFLWAEKKF